ncbi:Radical S-adenosyl methionine and flavodoxin domain protein [Spraguea lophii 42_110]|uniref:S-adenosyl-L-methionine-dependent tRNA 4-demethylwyosine synthase n=1 Tax=Spraguea lophii (strain 42_110) TaxID=1358809 RepID=S7W738_SPRLO|nr:Radical S-adenosyl methionine and flavodoxin domain protein [Spraguea lophii 42_110]
MLKILYATETNRSFSYATNLSVHLTQHNIDHSISCLSEYTIDNLKEESHVVIIVSTFFEGMPPRNGKQFYDDILDMKNDFRVGRGVFGHLKYSVFGLGSRAYKELFNVVAREMDRALYELGGKRIIKTEYGDEYENMDNYFDSWMKKFTKNYVEEIFDGENEEYGNILDDIEDLGAGNNSKEMATPSLKRALTKQGYKIVGTHSGVKLCRWTKSMLKGRGGCYKNSFYNIESHRCMEMTPSLACANKCIFCWRHYTNPVGTEWRWEVDNPKLIFGRALEEHRKMVMQMRTAPGVLEHRYKEGLDVKHCALSLVGEPIMYPYINEFVDMLHSNSISSFLVTNAQFPEQLKSLKTVTQLYLSIDAPTKEALYKIDRPLHKDYWSRFTECIKILKDRKERTVFRLTLIKNYNNDDIIHYTTLINLGQPDFIEIKGVTFCGYTESTPMKMDNVPYHEDVQEFSKKLLKEINNQNENTTNIDINPEYDIAAEHKHTCSVLIAKTIFKKNNKWHTHIDFNKFHELIKSNEEFSAIDYSIETPEWTLPGAKEEGFNPVETRHKRNKNKAK